MAGDNYGDHCGENCSMRVLCEFICAHGERKSYLCWRLGINYGEPSEKTWRCSAKVICCCFSIFGEGKGVSYSKW